MSSIRIACVGLILLCVAGCNFVKEPAIEETVIEDTAVKDTVLEETVVKETAAEKEVLALTDWIRGRPEPADIKTKREKIETEIARLKDHPWAGQFGYSHDHSGRILTLAPENGFVLNDWGHWERNDIYGTVEWDGIHIKLASENPGDPIREVHTKYRLVRWGERLYLIPDSEIIEFCYDVHTSNEPRYAFGWGRYLLRLGDWIKEVKGKPEIPDEFLQHLLDEPVDALFLSVTIGEKQPYHTANVVLNKGKNDGLLPGMKLCAEERNDRGGYNSMTLTKVDEMQSEGLLHHDGVLPKAGQEYSTYARWVREINEHIQERDKQKQ